MRRIVIVGLLGSALLGITACGGGGGGGGSVIGGGGGSQFAAYSTYAAQCAVPRSGKDPWTGDTYPDRMGSTTTENRWLRSWTHDLYLWYSEVSYTDPASVSSTSAYFDLMKTTALLPSGQKKDKFHFNYPTDLWEQYSLAGASVGYGVSWKIPVANQVFVEFVEPNTPSLAGIKRGDEVLSVDGVDVHSAATTTQVDAIFAGLLPSAINEQHTFVFADRNGGANYTKTLTSSDFISNPVPTSTVLNTASGPVGYLLFTDHNLPAESELIDAFNQFKNSAVTDLVIDMRYNGGGYLFIASQLAYMIAGPGVTNGKTFETTVFNDQHPTKDPVTGDTLQPTPFFSTTSGLGSRPGGQALPFLNLTRVYVLTTNETCSASESVINGLRGVGITVYQIGADTCGKPYGFYPADNCGTTYFSIQFQGKNQAGFGDYPEGFSATRTNIAAGARLPGCTVADDLTHDLGDTGEGQLAAALGYRTSSSCPVSSGKPQLQPAEAPSIAPAQPWQVPARPWRENRFLTRPRQL